MSNYNTLKTTINANIKQNGNQEITGQILNSVLNQMVSTLGTGYQFAGVATLDPATEPGTPDAKVFYIANGKGTYTNFGGLEVMEDEVVVLYYDTEWHKVATGIASQTKLSELDKEVNGINKNIQVASLAELIPTIIEGRRPFGTTIIATEDFSMYCYSVKSGVPVILDVAAGTSSMRISFSTSTDIGAASTEYFALYPSFSEYLTFENDGFLLVGVKTDELVSITCRTLVNGIGRKAYELAATNNKFEGGERMINIPFINQMGWWNGVLGPNPHTIASPMRLRVADFINPENKLVFVDANDRSDGKKLMYAIQLFNESGVAIARLGYQENNIIDLSSKPTAYYFYISLGLMQGTSDIGGLQKNYGLEKIYLQSNVYSRNSVLKVTDASEDGLSINDTRGGQIVEFKDGHISTKHFSSKDFMPLRYEYMGTAIKLRNTFDYKKIFSFRPVSNTTHQGAANFGKYLFQFHHSNDYVNVVNLDDKFQIQNIEMTEHDSSYHCNVVNFGKEYASEDDSFPLLYVAQETSICLVYRVTGNVGAFSLTLVQTITLPPHSEQTGYFHNCLIDKENNRLIMCGLTKNVWYPDFSNSIIYSVYDLPKLNEGDITINDNDLISRCIVHNMPTTQGGFCKGGKVIQGLGVNGSSIIAVIDYLSGNVESIIPLNECGFSGEIESCYTYNGKIYFTSFDANIYEINLV